MKNLTID